MRDIAFRGVDIRSGEMIFGSLIQEQEKTYILPFNLTKGIPTQLQEIDPETVGQCTSVEDKNGILVHEGDIIEYTSRYFFIEFAPANKLTTKVVWHECGFRLKGIPWSLSQTAESEICVIGNIHKNPGLLTNANI